MNTQAVLLAVLMFLVTYPSRALGLLAPAMDRLPRRALDYLPLVGPAGPTPLGPGKLIGVGTDAGPRVHGGLGGLGRRACLAHLALGPDPFLGAGGAGAVAARGRYSCRRRNRSHSTA